jgi:hypothetical protein
MTEDHQVRWSDAKLEQFYSEFKQHAERERILMADLLKAFPNEDPVSHRMYHEAVMRASEEQERFWRELRVEIAKKTIWGVITILAGLVLAGVAVKFGVKP